MHWRNKVYIQFVLAHLPQGEKVNFLLQKMNGRHNSQEAKGRIGKPIENVKFIRPHLNFEGSRVVEIGTGWLPVNTLVLYLCGAKEIHTYDHVRHLRLEVAQTAVEGLKGEVAALSDGLSLPKDVILKRLSVFDGARDLETFFKRANINYVAPGDASKTGLAANSIDLVYSYAVLEHIPEDAIDAINVEVARVLKPAGVAYHGIGLHDHYVSADKRISKVNFLQYSEAWWKFFVKNKISYHNRLREKDFIERFEKSGARITARLSKTDPRDLEALKTMRIDPRFSRFTPEELAVTGSEVILTYRPDLPMQ